MKVHGVPALLAVVFLAIDGAASEPVQGISCFSRSDALIHWRVAVIAVLGMADFSLGKILILYCEK